MKTRMHQAINRLIPALNGLFAKLRKPHLLLLLALMLASQQCAVNPVTGKKEFMLLSNQQEQAMGVQADPEIVAAYGLYPSDELQSFIDRKGQEMVKVSHRGEIKYQFRILDSPIVNAFAVPGGYVYFTRGIMAHLNSEAEFAGVLGHEIGHIAARHSAKQYSRTMVTQFGLALGSVLSEDFAQFAGLAQTGASLLFLKYGRDAERESDRLGVEYSTRIGYDAHEMAGFFGTLKRMGGESAQSLPAFMSTHPDPGEREQKVMQLADKWQQKVKTEDDFVVNRNAYLQLIDGIVYGNDPRQGYVADGRFFHPELKFQFPVPDGWSVENTPQQVSMVAPSGQALILLSLAQGQSLDAAAQQVVSQYGLTNVQGEKISVNGNHALRLFGGMANQGGELGVMVYLIEYGKLIYQFSAAAAKQQFSGFAPVAEKVAGGFDRLTDASRLNVAPQRIDIREVKQTQPLSDVLTAYRIPADQQEEVAVLNGMKVNDRVAAGTLLKVITGEAVSDRPRALESRRP